MKRVKFEVIVEVADDADEAALKRQLHSGISFVSDEYRHIEDSVRFDIVRESIQPDTPPLLRWEGETLLVGDAVIASVWKPSDPFCNTWMWRIFGRSIRETETQQAARRAAEKALGFPEGFIAEEV